MIQRPRQTRDAAVDIWGPRTPSAGGWSERIDEHLVAEPDRWVQSACVLCANGCALDIGVKDGRIVGVRGRGVDRINRGRLGPKGLYGWQANNSPDRLTHPLVRRHGRLERATWDEAMSLIVGRTRELRERYTANTLAFYTSGQLMLEEYYTLGLLVRAGLGTPHLDGNTRLCTATAATALIESFGTDGDPGSYADIDLTDCLLLVGHNMAETQTVLWARVLDRRRGSKPPKLVVVDPRRTATAAEADVHLALRPGTNVALLNGLLRLLIHEGHVDEDFVRDRTVGYAALRRTVERYMPELVEEITAVPQERLRAAARIIGEAPTLVATCLQGVYQSNQATAAAVQVNNLVLLRGMIGRPGCTVFQMNGQPTAQNTRECGADGELAAFYNWDNPRHIAELARRWNVDPGRIPTWSPPTHIMQIMRHIEEGSIRFLWVTATNPAVSLPNLKRVRSALEQEHLFLVVNDAFLTETAQVADVVLPTALWGEKTGCFTNADRTVHIARKAVEPPGEARSDLDILLDYARRMDFRDQDGAPLVKWTDPEGAFEAFRELTRGRPCDYSGLSYAKLSEGSGIQWPCNASAPDGTERLYTDHVFNTASAVCETYGHDLVTGAPVQAEEHRAADPAGRAVLKAAEHQPPDEDTDGRYPLLCATGRVVHHFHTRTKTGRARELAAAAGDPIVQLSREDAQFHRIAEGDLVEVASRRGQMRGYARIGDIPPGRVFVPFHYGSWDRPEGSHAANELTLTAWDPVSKQPCFKLAAVAIRRVGDGRPPP